MVEPINGTDVHSGIKVKTYIFTSQNVFKLLLAYSYLVLLSMIS
uniref:Uncharacterized protein n=1 Tax=Arundo donax TaxID=35708 RepID=A0A0A9FVP5_ARUDO